MTDNAPIIEIKNLKKTYHSGDVDGHALRGVTLDIRKGEFVSIVGPSGSGKSTLFHVLGGLTPATSGPVQINGTDLAKMTDPEWTNLRKRTVGFVFPKYNLLPTLTVSDNIEIARDIAGNTEGKDQKFQEVLRLLGIDHRLNHKP